MSVIVTLRFTGDAAKLEEFAAANDGHMQGIIEAAKGHGLIAHRFYGSEDGTKVLIVDEWPDRESFETFAEEQAPQIEPMLKAAGGKGVAGP